MVLSKDLKFAICFGLIIGALFSFCSMCFAFEGEVVDDVVFVQHLIISTLGDSFYYDTSLNGGLLYISVEAGRTYFIESPNGLVNCALSSSVPADGVPFEILANRVDYYSFTAIEDGYFLVASSSNSDVISDVIFSVRPTEGLDYFVQGIIDVLTFDNISNIWILTVPILAISVLFGLGFYLVKRIMNKIKRAKGGV